MGRRVDKNNKDVTKCKIEKTKKIITRASSYNTF